jgi:hypothetical protein
LKEKRRKVKEISLSNTLNEIKRKFQESFSPMLPVDDAIPAVFTPPAAGERAQTHRHKAINRIRLSLPPPGTKPDTGHGTLTRQGRSRARSAILFALNQEKPAIAALRGAVPLRSARMPANLSQTPGPP